MTSDTVGAAAASFTIGRLAKLAGVNIDTVRFYERQGLLEQTPRSAGGYRLYRAAQAQRLRFIRRAKALGFSLDDIAELLQLTQDGQDRSQVRSLAQRHAAELQRRIGELQAMHDMLSHHLQHCSGRGPVKGCPIVAALGGEDSFEP
jgi:MerR family copper efflux transcriptional regulator